MNAAEKVRKGFRVSAQLMEFRTEVEDFLDSNASLAVLEAGAKTTSVFSPWTQSMEWHRCLAARGWSAVDWPVEYGGTGWSEDKKAIFHEECNRRGLPSLMPHGLKMLGPLLIDLGSDAQKKKYLPGILSGEDFWCQGYSEPNSGTDLTSLNCKAEIDGSDYIINGSKIWTTFAFHANKMFMLVRTGRGEHNRDGITFLLVDDMNLQGMTVRKIIGLDGLPEQAEVFFENVRVPQANRIGEEGQGWAVANHLLKHERGDGTSLSELRKLDAIAQAAKQTRNPAGILYSEDPAFQMSFGTLVAEVKSVIAIHKLAQNGDAIASDPALPSILKTLVSENQQALSKLCVQISGLEAMPWQVDALQVGSGADPLGTDFELIAMPYYLCGLSTSIYGGTNEIQRDLISRSVLRRS